MKVKKLLVSTVAAVCLFGTVTAFAASASMDGGCAYLNARYSNRLRECDAGTIRNNESDYACDYESIHRLYSSRSSGYYDSVSLTDK